MKKNEPTAPPGASGAAAAPPDPSAYRSNPEVDARIDAYIKENPRFWSHVQAMPRTRLERTIVLGEIRQLDRQQRMREGLMKSINRNPEQKRALEVLVKDLPEDQREAVMSQIARQTQRAAFRSRDQDRGETVTP